MIGIEAPKQLIVLGGGLTSEGYPTQETAERAVSTAYYADKYGADKIIFSGGQGLLATGLAVVRAEADVQADIAVAHGLDPASIRFLDKQSRSTFETFLNVKDEIANEATAVLTHAYHIPRALRMARRTLDVPLTGYEAMAEYTGKSKAPFNERLLRAITMAAMVNVAPGDTEMLRQRNDMVARTVTTPARTALLAKTILRNHTSVRAEKARGFTAETLTAQ